MDIIYKNNERETNETAAKAVLLFACFTLLVCVLCWLSIFNISRRMTNLFLSTAFLPLMLPAALVLLLHINNSFTKYIIITCVSVVTAIAYIVFTFQAVLVFIIPSIISVFYLDKKIMLYAGAVTTIMITVSHLVTARYLFQPSIEPFSGLGPIMLYGALPRIIQFLCVFTLLHLLRFRIREFMNGYQKALRDTRLVISDPAEKEPSKELPLLLGRLSQREQDVFRLLAQGHTNAQIADTLCLSNGTVKNYVSSIYDKTEISSRTELILKFSRYYPDYDRSNNK